MTKNEQTDLIGWIDRNIEDLEKISRETEGYVAHIEKKLKQWRALRKVAPNA